MGVGSSLIYAPANLCRDARADRARHRGRQMRRHVHQPHALRRKQAARGDRRADRDQQAVAAPRPRSTTSSRRASPTGASSTPRSPRSKRRPRGGPAHHRRHVHLHRRRHRPRRRHAAVGAVRRPRGVDRADEGSGRRARALVKEMRTPTNDWENLMLLAGQPGQGAARRLQEPEAEAADRQDARRGRADARQEPGRDRDRPRHRGRQPRRHRLFPDERGQCEARGRPAVGELRLRRSVRGARRRVPQVEQPPARLRQRRAPARPLRARRKGGDASGRRSVG